MSCAYYNILWTANKEYDKATKDLEFAEFWDPYEQEKLTGEKAKLIDSAASRCGKMLVLYPDSRWADDALLLMGKCFLLSQDYGKALTKFREVSTLYGGDELAGEARYLEAYTLVLNESSVEAVKILQSLAAGAKKNLIRQKSSYLLARIAFENGNCLLAIDRYVAYLEAYPEGARAGHARLALGECLLKLGMYREAIDDLDPLTGEADEDGFQALLSVGKAYRMLGETETAIGVFGRVLAEADQDTLRGRAGIEEALTLADDERFLEAIDALTMADSLANRKLSGEVDFQIGFIYERDLSDFDKAIEYYDKSVALKSPFVRSAARRSNALKDVKKYTEDIAAGAGDTAKSMYLLAETYLYDLGMREKALDELMAVCDSFPESEYAARSMLAIASFLESESDTSSEYYYRRVIEDFPNTAYANVARIGLGLAPVDIVVEEPEPVPADSLAAPDSLAARTGAAAADTVGRAEEAAPVERETPSVPGEPGMADTAGITTMPPPAEEGLPGIPDSLRSRSERYMSRTPPDSAARDSTGLFEEDRR
jgi:tetratricopeptide (TPR) repeat protein